MRTLFRILRAFLSLALGLSAFAFFIAAEGADPWEWSGLAGLCCLVSASLLWATVRPDDGKKDTP